MALEIINERGEIMELTPDMKIPVERNNPLFNDADKFFQDITYPGTAPLSPANKSFFNYGHLVDAKNEVYEFPVQLYVSGTHFFSGQLQYRVAKNGFNFQLLVNFATVVDKVKRKFGSIADTDEGVVKDLTEAQFEALMYNTCKFPENHNYVFAPVYNDKISNDAAELSFNWMNYFIVGAGFETAVPQNTYRHVECPFFKLTHILKKIITYLGFKPTGGFFDDPEINKIYIYTRRSVFPAPDGQVIRSHFSYMPPGLLISDFLKQIRERVHVGIEFDLITRTAKAESVSAALYSASNLVDISDYVESIEEINRPEQKGLTAVLEPDAFDELFVDDDKTTTQKLVVNQGSDNITELKCSTLKAETNAGKNYLKTRQSIIKPGITWYGSFETPLNWSLRLFKYNGMKLVNGQEWPESVPYSLGSTEDESWYRFINDAKKIILYANIPPVELAKLKPSNRIAFVTAEGIYTECVVLKISYDLGEQVSLIKTKIEAYRISNQSNTTITVEAATTSTDTGGRPSRG
jgi:hypothetical protein